MPIPDPHTNEPTIEADRALVVQYQQAAGNAAAWQAIADRLKAQMQEQIGDNYALTLDGEKVFTYRPTRGYAEAQLRKQYPDLTQHFFRTEARQVFDMEAFAIRHSEIAEQFRIRSFREAFGG